MSAIGVSIVICCFNGRERITETLRHIQAQEVNDVCPWEVILVDNASTDGCADLAREIWAEKPVTHFRVVREETPGLSHARTRAIDECHYEYISFVDDDNWVAQNWVSTVFRTFERYDRVGACGGMITAEFAIEPPRWFGEFEAFFAVGPQSSSAGPMLATQDYLCGAGLCVRNSLASNMMREGFVFNLVGRQGKKLMGSEDVELCLAIKLNGWQLWYEPQLRLVHFMPAERLSWQYLKRLSLGTGGSYAGLVPYFLGYCQVERVLAD